MNRLKKTAIVGVAGLSLAGGSVAVAALSPLGIAGAQEDGTEQTRPDRIGDGLADILAELVEDGTLTQEQADAVGERVDERRDERRAEFEAFRAEHEADREAMMQELADAAGVTVEELADARDKGESLADIAGDNVDAVIELLVQQQTDRIDEAVDNGRLDQERADEILTDVEQRVTDMVNGEGFAGPGFGHRGGHHGPGGGFGPGRGFGPGDGFGPDDGAPGAPAEDEPAAFDVGA
ncbi:MAG: hypothetical protein OEW42_04620 [Acidimicrobiia bacterium]|nr:hypothetical protein [Acidimicrobiia bacterium]MDH5236398.1 hypothetical protein [Acidimicrobiia bacterium]